MTCLIASILCHHIVIFKSCGPIETFLYLVAGVINSRPRESAGLGLDYITGLCAIIEINMYVVVPYKV